jgi:hypothetical protein
VCVCESELNFFKKIDRITKILSEKKPNKVEKENNQKTPGMFGIQYQFCRRIPNTARTLVLPHEINSGEAELPREIIFVLPDYLTANIY